MNLSYNQVHGGRWISRLPLLIAATSLAACAADKPAALPWKLPAEVRVKEVRESEGKRLEYQYTLAIELLASGEYSVRIRGLPLERWKGKVTPWEEVERGLTTYFAPRVVDAAGNFMRFEDEAGLRRERLEVVRRMRKRDPSLRPGDSDEAIVDELLDQARGSWSHWTTPIQKAPADRGAVERESREVENGDKWSTVRRFVGATPDNAGLLRYESESSIVPAPLESRAQVTKSHETKIVADVLPDSLRPVHVDVETHEVYTAGEQAAADHMHTTYDLDWFNRKLHAGPAVLGSCTPAIVRFPYSARLVQFGDAFLELTTCATGLPTKMNNAVLVVTGDPPLGAIELRLLRTHNQEVLIGRFEAGATSAVLSGAGAHSIEVTREAADGPNMWTKVVNVPVAEIADMLIEQGVELAGEELLSKERVTFRFDAIPLWTIAQLMAGISGQEYVHGAKRGRFVVPDDVGARED